MNDFLRFAASHGLDIRVLKTGDRVHRCPTVDKPRSDNGAYMYDGRGRGWVQDWANGQPPQWFNDENAKPWSEEEKKALARRRAESRRERAERARHAARTARSLLESCELLPHGYLATKGFPEFKTLVTPDHELIVPMRSVEDNALIGAQRIFLHENEWTKKFLWGTPPMGAVLRLGPPNATESALVEGYATGLTADAAAKRLCARVAVYVCFTASNVVHVAERLTGKRYVLVDHDTTRGTAGQRCADATELPWVMSDVPGEDINDLHQREGLMAVARLLMVARNASAGGRAR